jgi:hypothetical protein
MRNRSQVLTTIAAAICFPVAVLADTDDGWAPEGRTILSASSAVWNQPTLTTFELKRSTWKRTDTLEVTDIQGDVVYYVEEHHNVFNSMGEPIPLKGALRERDGEPWVVLEMDHSVSFWHFRNHSSARMKSNLTRTGIQAAWGNGQSVMVSLSFDSEGRASSYEIPSFDTAPSGLIHFTPFSYWSATATAEHSRAKGLLDEQEDGSYRLHRDSDVGHDLTIFDVSEDGPPELMLRETLIEYDDEEHSFRYIGLQRFGGLGLPTSVEIDRVTAGGKEISEIRITDIKVEYLEEAEFAEVLDGLVARIDR